MPTGPSGARFSTGMMISAQPELNVPITPTTAMKPAVTPLFTLPPPIVISALARREISRVPRRGASIRGLVAGFNWPGHYQIFDRAVRAADRRRHRIGYLPAARLEAGA